MAIQPIDLQTLFSQLDKVGKTQSFAQHGMQLQQAIEQDETARRMKEKHAAVEGAADAGDEGPRMVKEQKNSRDQDGEHKKHNAPEEDVPEAKKNVISDPTLGQHIDISG